MKMLSRPVDQMQDHYSAVVVGSGYGGAIAADRIARAGRDVCVLERGKELHPGEYPNTALSAAREIQVHTPKADHGSAAGLFDFHVGPDVTVLSGCGLGGTSLINANVALEPSDAIFSDDRWPTLLRHHPEVLRPFMRAAKGMLGSNPYPQGMAGSAQAAGPRTGGRGPGRRGGPSRPQRDVHGRPERRRGEAERVRPVRRLLFRLQLRREEHRPDELSPGRVRARRAHLHRGGRAVGAPMRGQVAGGLRRAGRGRRAIPRRPVPVRHGRRRRARRRDARVDADPAPVTGPGAAGVGPARARVLRQRRCAGVRLRHRPVRARRRPWRAMSRVRTRRSDPRSPA